MTQMITRNGLPPRHVVEGFKHLCTDEVGYGRIEALKARYVGKAENTPEVRAKLRLEMKNLLMHLKHEGRLFRKDGEALL